MEISSQFLSLTVFALLLGACSAAPPENFHQDSHETLQRSAFFAGTATAPTGELQIETSASWDPGETLVTGLSLAYGLDSRTEVTLGFLPYLEVDRPGSDARGAGSLAFGVTRRLVGVGDGGPSLALVLEGELPAGKDDPDLSSGEPSLGAGLIALHELGGLVGVVAYRMNVLGESGETGLDIEHQADLSLAGSVAHRWAFFAILSGRLAPETGESESTATLGSALSLSGRILLDVGVRLGLDDEDSGTELLVGLTFSF